MRSNRSKDYLCDRTKKLLMVRLTKHMIPQSCYVFRNIESSLCIFNH